MSEIEELKEVICCSAIKISDGRVFIGTRHDECFKQIAKCNGGKPDMTIHFGCIDGFMTNKCRFLTRKEACNFALDTGQRLKYTAHRNDALFSEDLW